MADIAQQMGAGLIQHLKAYIDGQFMTPVGDGSSSAPAAVVQASFFDPFNLNLSPLSLPLPMAFSRAVVLLVEAPGDDHVVVRVSSHSWEDFYRRLLSAAKRFPEFLDTAVNVQQRFGFASSPISDLPEISVIPAGTGYAALADWVGRYDQVYSAVLVMRFAAGTVPQEYRT